MTERSITRRQLIGGATAVGVASTLPTARAAAAGRGSVRADVAIVGAGLAGLTAARALVRAGRSVVVMESDDRVGGRTENHRPTADYTNLRDVTPSDSPAAVRGASAAY